MACASGAPWRDIPERYGPWESVYSRFHKWIDDGILDNIFRVLSLEVELEELSLDASIVQAHQHSAGAKKGGLQTKMALHKSDEDADELWQYFQEYNEYHNRSYNSSAISDEVKLLHEDDEVQKPKGIYEYLLCKGTAPYAGRLLNLRAFDKRDKMAAYTRQNGIYPICGQHFEFNEMEGDHIKPWSKGGQTTPDNCQMICKDCNEKKTDKY